LPKEELILQRQYSAMRNDASTHMLGNLACFSISLEHGHQVWLLSSPDTSIVPNIAE
jgi:hypothetical protein